jgi:NAD(P)-dependent dehydrogenase (short-subunit alcohol dehydrogenase family)
MVNIASASSFIGQASTPAYTASKHAALGLKRSIALDYAAIGLRCNCICPGITDTPMLRFHLNTTSDPEATLARRMERVPMGVAIQPADVAKGRAVFFLRRLVGYYGHFARYRWWLDGLCRMAGRRDNEFYGRCGRALKVGACFIDKMERIACIRVQ